MVYFPDACFNPAFDVCFCHICHDKRGDNLKYLRGDPPVNYGLPIGWCKFGLRFDIKLFSMIIFFQMPTLIHPMTYVSAISAMTIGVTI